MAQIWTFSPSSEAQLLKCIAASAPPDENNKWVREFVRKIDENDNKHNLPEQNHKQMDVCEEKAKPDSHDDFKEFIEMIESEYTLDFDTIVEECCKNHNLFIYLAQRLSTPSIEKFFKQVCTIQKSEDFLVNFYTIFIPTTIKREYCRYILDFLVQSRLNHKKYLETLLDMLIKDSTIPRNVLNDYILTLNLQEQVDFLKYILDTDINAECFANNIPVVYSIYKDCSKLNDIHNKIVSSLIQNEQHCRNDRHYGKLLLAFLQTEQQSMDTRLNMKVIKEIVERHRSAFRRPCEIILNKIIDVEFD